MWAVDGLAGVLLGNSSGDASRPARNPRALLWGQHTGQLSWAGENNPLFCQMNKPGLVSRI